VVGKPWVESWDGLDHLCSEMALTDVVVDLIFSPGSSLKLVPVINVSILALLVLLCVLAYSKIAVIHLVVLSTLAVGLLLSVNWFYYEFQKATSASTAEGEGRSTHDASSSTSADKED